MLSKTAENTACPHLCPDGRQTLVQLGQLVRDDCKSSSSFCQNIFSFPLFTFTWPCPEPPQSLSLSLVGFSYLFSSFLPSRFSSWRVALGRFFSFRFRPDLASAGPGAFLAEPSLVVPRRRRRRALSVIPCVWCETEQDIRYTGRGLV